MNRLEQIEAIEQISSQINAALKELELLKQSISEVEINTNVPANLTIKDLFKAIKKYQPSSASRLRHICLEHNINTLDELLKYRPRELKKWKNIGTTTIYHVREALEDLGIIW